jgi:hypothetical protein
MTLMGRDGRFVETVQGSKKKAWFEVAGTITHGSQDAQFYNLNGILERRLIRIIWRSPQKRSSSVSAHDEWPQTRIPFKEARKKAAQKTKKESEKKKKEL